MARSFPQTSLIKAACNSACKIGHLCVVQLLVERGADVNKLNSDNRTSLHRASEKGHMRIAELLSDKGAFVNIANVHGWTALHYASKYGRHSVTQLLIKRGADINKANRSGRPRCTLRVEMGTSVLSSCLWREGQMSISLIATIGLCVLVWDPCLRAVLTNILNKNTIVTFNISKAINLPLSTHTFFQVTNC